jgi:hypothetical protein
MSSESVAAGSGDSSHDAAKLTEVTEEEQTVVETAVEVSVKQDDDPTWKKHLESANASIHAVVHFAGDDSYATVSSRWITWIAKGQLGCYYPKSALVSDATTLMGKHPQEFKEGEEALKHVVEFELTRPPKDPEYYCGK